MFDFRNNASNTNHSQKVNLGIGLIALIIALVICLIILILFRFLPSKLPLFYSLAWGDAQLATAQQFLIIPASISLITLLNLIISWQLHPQQIFFKQILIFTSLITALILLITFTKIVLIFV